MKYNVGDYILYVQRDNGKYISKILNIEDDCISVEDLAFLTKNKSVTRKFKSLMHIESSGFKFKIGNDFKIKEVYSKEDLILKYPDLFL